jgi:hypothetical protein
MKGGAQAHGLARFVKRRAGANLKPAAALRLELVR